MATSTATGCAMFNGGGGCLNSGVIRCNGSIGGGGGGCSDGLQKDNSDPLRSDCTADAGRYGGGGGGRGVNGSGGGGGGGGVNTAVLDEGGLNNQRQEHCLQNNCKVAGSVLSVGVNSDSGLRKRENTESKVTCQTEFADHYPDGGWGYVVLAAATVVYGLCSGFHFAYGSLYLKIQDKFGTSDMPTALLGSVGIAVSLFVSPFVTIICRRKSPRLCAVIGALVCALGCLFLAFSTECEQLFISHCGVMSIGSGVTLVTADIMVGRYFRRKREFVEIILVAGCGLGTAFMSLLFEELIGSIEWMHGLQCVAGLLILPIICGALYRSANLYHPRRKVILHLKSQKKNRRDREAEKPPYFDFSALKLTSLKAVMVIAGVVGIGIHIPFVLLVSSAHRFDEDMNTVLPLSVYLGFGFVIGCGGVGYLTVRNSSECFISRRHLCQTSAMLCGLWTLLLVLAKDNSSFTLYAWAYGISSGCYYYSLKTYVYELVRSKLMERAWNFLKAAQSFPILFGAPAASYLNTHYNSQVAGYVLAGIPMILGGLLFYAMPMFERHPSNQAVLQKHNSNPYSSANMTEAAALLDLDVTDGFISSKVNHSANKGPNPAKPSNQSNCSSSGSSSCCNGRGENCGVHVQLQCFAPYKEREKALQQAAQGGMLTKITEEKDKFKSSSGTNLNNVISSTKAEDKIPNFIELSVTRTDYTEENIMEKVLDSPNCGGGGGGVGGGGGGGGAGKNKRCGKDTSCYGRFEGKKNKKNEVRIDLFDPPSQEKESTATVSYDSDLYINLCEAQV